MGELDRKVREYIKEEVRDWEDPEKCKARFKALSGQRSDWEGQYNFWRGLIINISRRFDILFLSPSQLIYSWFNLSGLTPLCLNNVLLEMYKCGELVRVTDLGDPKSGHLSNLFHKMTRFASFPNLNDILNHQLILVITLQDKAAQLLKTLSETHWTSSCIITINKFESLFLDKHEAHAVLSYLSGRGRAKYLSINNKQLIEGVKISLTSEAISSIPKVDYDMLQLFWTVEDLQQQLDAIDKQYERSRQFAVAALRSGDKNVALRNARQLKLASNSREKLVSFLNRVDGVLHAVLDAESTKKVSEAIQAGARAINEHRIEVEEVQSCLHKLDEMMKSQAAVNKALESNTDDDEDVEEELQLLELQIRDETLVGSNSIAAEDGTRNAEQASAFTNSLSSAMADLKLQDDTKDLCVQGSEVPKTRIAYNDELYG